MAIAALGTTLVGGAVATAEASGASGAPDRLAAGFTTAGAWQAANSRARSAKTGRWVMG